MSSTGSTGAQFNQWLLLNDTGGMFSMPDSTSPLNAVFVVADRNSTSYMGLVFWPAVVSGASTGPLITAVTPAGVGTSIYYNGTFYGDFAGGDLVGGILEGSNLRTNGSNYLDIAGATSGSRPVIRSFGVDTDVDVAVNPQGTGLFAFEYGADAPGGGAAATLATIGGDGPGAAAQAYWLPVRVNGTKYYLPLWST